MADHQDETSDEVLMRVEQCRGKYYRDSERMDAKQMVIGLFGWTMIDWLNVPPNGDKCCGCLCPCYRDDVDYALKANFPFKGISYL